jgi:hypothetical protein
MFAACATPYQAAGPMGGYRDRQINDRSFEVWFHGNGSTSSARAEQGALRRAAELTIANNMAGFAITQDLSILSQSSWNQPVICTTQGYSLVYSPNCTGGETQTVAKPSAHIVIYLLKADEAIAARENGRTVYDAGLMLGWRPLIVRAQSTQGQPAAAGRGRE